MSKTTHIDYKFDLKQRIANENINLVKKVCISYIFGSVKGLFFFTKTRSVEGLYFDLRYKNM